MNIPESVTDQIQKGPLDNLYFYKAEKAWSRMTQIKEGKVEYIDDDYSSLINTLERFYKGFIQTKLDFCPDFKLPPYFLTSDHDLQKLANEIEKDCQIFLYRSHEDMKNRNRFLQQLRKAYTAGRYTMDYSKEDFDQLYDLVQKQKTRIETYLQKTYQKDEIKEQDDYALDL